MMMMLMTMSTIHQIHILLITLLAIEATENYALLVQTLRSDKVTADVFDLYWRKCAPLRFKQIAEAKTTTEILNLWPEYTKPSAFQFINIDFVLKYPSAKCLKDRWTQLEGSILNILKSKSGCSILLKDLQKVGSNNEDIHLNHALYLTNLSVPRIIDASQKAKLFCSYEMANQTLNSVKWYKDGQEFFRYSPLTPPTTNWFPVRGVTIAEGSSHCNQFICNVELKNLNVHSSGSYRCEVSGDAPEFKLVDKTANMTVGVLPKFDPFISGLQHTYRYGDSIILNCSSEWSNPPAILTWYINNKTATMTTVQPQINEFSRSSDGFVLSASNLQLRIYVDDQRFIGKSEVLELKCAADIMGIASIRRETKVRATILSLADTSNKQRLLGGTAMANSINTIQRPQPYIKYSMLSSPLSLSYSVWRLIRVLIMMALAYLWQTVCCYFMFLGSGGGAWGRS